jgi:hypothetical protein
VEVSKIGFVAPGISELFLTRSPFKTTSLLHQLPQMKSHLRSQQKPADLTRMVTRTRWHPSLKPLVSVRSWTTLIQDPAAAFTSFIEQIPLQKLFNFSDDTWKKLMERIGMISLDDEVEFYELVELGEADDQTFKFRRPNLSRGEKESEP